MDQQNLDFYRRVRGGYLTMAHQEPERWLVIDATQAIEAIHQLIWQRIEIMLHPI
jgi:dTMP kinase